MKKRTLLIIGAIVAVLAVSCVGCLIIGSITMSSPTYQATATARAAARATTAAMPTNTLSQPPTETRESAQTVEPEAEARATPVPTVDISGCTLGAVFEADVTVPDNTEIEASQSFTKTWLIRNTGSCDWGAGYRLTFIDGNQLGGPDSVDVPGTPVGESVEISVELSAPMKEGRHRSEWQICINETECFGDMVYVQIVSVAAMPKQTATPAAVVEWEGVYIGMPADDVLKIHPKSETTGDPVKLGEDSAGLIVRWSYPGAYLIFAMRTGEDNVTCYRVVEIQLR